MAAIYSRGKRAKANHKGRLITIFLLLTIIGAIIYLLAINFMFDKNTQEVAEENIVVENIVEENVIEEKQDEISNEKIPETMSGYKVLGQLVIEKIGVKKNILSTSNTSTLKLSVAKDYGPDINAPGNFCMCGHNWSNMLERLHELEEGDKLYLVNRETKTKVNYEVYKVYTCGPKDVSCLEQNNDGKREVTIYTCTPGGAKRVVCKAREI